ncbi:DNA adenine methylase [Arthrobacter cavernae]|uniref:site-specific DNA-methyltransferase (adenine-specific) n=1 Tax=Arthrobacter cavernae TaxID=2817681 RepID=A0A939KLE7_9MICC|nr:DNA adenine methylase [Arthrobacter cavernae]MBO1267076.1 DNA adenine methylase [Arthrobacter cavernae]
MTLSAELLTNSQMPWKTDGIRTVVQAFPYQGSKRQLVGQILSLFPDGGVPLLVEPFAGSAAISVAARHYGQVGEVALSDVNGPLMDLWQRIIDNPDRLIAEYTNLWNEQLEDPRSYFLKVREEFNQTKAPAHLLYLLCRVVKAAVRYSKNGDFNQSPDHRRLGAKPSNMQARIFEASRLMRGTSVSSESYESPLINAPREALVYMDPPYQGTTDVPDHRYLTGLRRDPFIETLQRAIDNQVSFIISYDVVRDDNKYGYKLPDELGLTHRHVVAGVSSQATLLGKKEMTVESLYLSPALVQRLGGLDIIDTRIDLEPAGQDALF